MIRRGLERAVAWRCGRALLAVASGLLLFLSFPKFGHGAVAWVALAPLLVALHGVAPGRALRLGLLAGTVGHVGLLYWTALVVVQFGGLPMAAAAPHSAWQPPSAPARVARSATTDPTAPAATRASRISSSEGWNSLR